MDYTPSTPPNEKVNDLVDMVPDMIVEERIAHKKIESFLYDLKDVSVKLKDLEIEMLLHKEKHRTEMELTKAQAKDYEDRASVLQEQLRSVGYDSNPGGLGPRSWLKLRKLTPDDYPGARKVKKTAYGGWIPCDSEEEDEEEQFEEDPEEDPED